MLLPKGYDAASRPAVSGQLHPGALFARPRPAGSAAAARSTGSGSPTDTPRFLYVTLQHPSPVLRRFVRRELGEQRPVRRRDHAGAHAGDRNAVPHRSASRGRACSRADRPADGLRSRTRSSIPTSTAARSPAVRTPSTSTTTRSSTSTRTRTPTTSTTAGCGSSGPTERRPDGTIVAMMKDENHYELTVGDHSRSGGQWDIWEATYSPVGADGYPRRIWNKDTGEIDHTVAEAWKKYDLLDILKTNWATLGPKVADKLNVYVGDMDSYYLNDAVENLLRVPPDGATIRMDGRDRVQAAGAALLGTDAAGAAREDDRAHRARRPHGAPVVTGGQEGSRLTAPSFVSRSPGLLLLRGGQRPLGEVAVGDVPLDAVLVGGARERDGESCSPRWSSRSRSRPCRPSRCRSAGTCRTARSRIRRSAFSPSCFSESESGWRRSVS